MQGFHIDGRLRLRSLPEHACRPLRQLLTPLLDLERVNREMKRRADVIGIFPNAAAIMHLVGALMLETNDE